MKLFHRAVHRPVTVTMCIIAMVVFGFVSFQRLGLDLLPDLQFPIVAIVTPYPNADPQTVEREVTTPIENALATIKGLRELESESVEHASIIIAHLEWGTDLNEAMDQLNVVLNVSTATLPSSVQRPVVLRMDPSQLPLMMIGLTGDQSSVELTTLADRHIQPVLESLPGVAQVSVLGGIRPEIAIYYDSDALLALGLTPYQLQQAIEYQNAMVPVGSRTFSNAELGIDGDGETRYLIRVGNAVQNVGDIESLIVGRHPERPPLGTIKLSDVATVEDRHIAAEGFTRIDSSPAVLIQVMKQSGENSVAVSKQIREALETLNIGSISPGTEMHIITDQSSLIVESLENVGSTAAVGAVLAVLVLLLFLRNWRSLTIIGLAIPLSIVLTFIFLYFSGLTLNLMTLGGLAIGIGMLVDNAIVVLENIYRLRAEGKDFLTAAKEGSSEMAAPIIASTITTIAVFVPLILAQSVAGHLVRELAITVSYALVASLVIALFVVPTLSAYLGRKRSSNVNSEAKLPSDTDIHVDIADATDIRWLTKLQTSYGHLLEGFIRRPLFTVGIIALFGVGLIVLPGSLHTEVLPPMDGGLVNIQLTLPPGSPTEATNRATTQIEQILLQHREVEKVMVYGGDQGGTALLDLIQESPTHIAEISALLVPSSERRQTAHDLAAELRQTLPVPEGATLRVSADRATDALGDDFAMAATLQLTGPDLDELKIQAARITDRLRDTPGFTDITSTAEEVQPELVFDIWRDRALGLGRLTVGEIALTMRSAFLGQEVTHIRREGTHVPVVLYPGKEDLVSYQALEDFRVFPVLSDGQPARFAGVLTTDSPIIELAPRSVQHVGGQRAVTITAQLSGIDLMESQRRVEQILADIDLPAGYNASLAGIHDTMQEALDDMGLALVLAIIFVFLVMAAQFESIKYPFIILFCVPLATVGGLAALLLTRHLLNVPSAMGLIALAGISVNNGIVLIDTYNRLRREGLPLDDAILTGSRIRLRPVLMTSLTTILALIPLALGLGTGADLQAPLAVTMIGGLVTSTALTLFIIPAIYRMASRTDRQRVAAEHGQLDSAG